MERKNVPRAKTLAIHAYPLAKLTKYKSGKKTKVYVKVVCFYLIQKIHTFPLIQQFMRTTPSVSLTDRKCYWFYFSPQGLCCKFHTFVELFVRSFRTAVRNKSTGQSFLPRKLRMCAIIICCGIVRQCNLVIAEC